MLCTLPRTVFGPTPQVLRSLIHLLAHYLIQNHTHILLLCRYYLRNGYCHKVVICQMRDREGFQQLLSTLKSMNVEYTIQEVTQSQYELAQRIQCSKATPSSATNLNNSKSNIKNQTYTHADSEEDDDVVSKIFTFPADLLYHASGEVIASSQGCAVDSISLHTDHLLHTPKENFVFLIIG